MTDHHPSYHPSDSGGLRGGSYGGYGGPGGDEDVPGPSRRFLAAMSLAETPEQQAVAREIYQRLEEGAEVDDVKDLIEQQMRIVVAQRNGRPVASADGPQPAAPNGIVGGVGRRPDSGGDGPGSGLDGGPGSGPGARPEGDRRDW